MQRKEEKERTCKGKKRKNKQNPKKRKEETEINNFEQKE